MYQQHVLKENFTLVDDEIGAIVALKAIGWIWIWEEKDGTWSPELSILKRLEAMGVTRVAATSQMQFYMNDGQIIELPGYKFKLTDSLGQKLALELLADPEQKSIKMVSDRMELTFIVGDEDDSKDSGLSS